MEEESKVVRREDTKEQPLTPWEQHATVISIPRFDYKAPSTFLQRSHSGFLITCTIKREKSATKEAISILAKYIKPTSCTSLDCSDVNSTSKRQKLCTDGASCPEEAVEKSSDDRVKSSDVESDSVLSLVKLTRSGLLLLTLPMESTLDATDVVSNIFQSLDSKDLKPPLWCHRVLPIQATCFLKEKELRETVSKLVLRFVNDKKNKLSQPLKFGAAYNKRGIEESANNKSSQAADHQIALFDRKKCFEVMAAAVKDVVPDSTVDLKSPELCILVELLPISGIPKGSFIAAVSVLPNTLVSTKPRLCIKPLVSESNTKSN